MNIVIEDLLALQLLELGPAPGSTEHQTEIRRLRQVLPAPILAHYDRLMTHGKKGVSLVRHGVCLECHMSLASGVFAQLLRAEDIQICGSCGRYLLHRPEEEVPPAATSGLAPGARKPTVRKKRAKKALAAPLA